MVLDQLSKIDITITTNVNFFTAIFKRKYKMTVNAISGEVAVISVSWQDYTPSGYAKGGHNGLLLECEEVTVPREGTARQWLAALVLQHDKELNQLTGCQYLNQSRSVVKTTLRGIAAA